MMASSTSNPFSTSSSPSPQPVSAEHKAPKPVLNPNASTFIPNKQGRLSQRSSPAHGNNISIQNTRRTGCPIVPSFTQEPALGSSTSAVQAVSPRPSYSSAASASISATSGISTTSDQSHPSQDTHPGALDLDLLPQRTQSAPPELHDKIPVPQSFIQATTHVQANTEQQRETASDALPEFTAAALNGIANSPEPSRRPSNEGKDFTPSYYKSYASGYKPSPTFPYPTMSYQNSHYTLTGYTPHGMALYSMNYIPSPIAPVSSPLVTQFSSSSSTLFVKPSVTRKILSIKHPDTKEEIVISKSTTLSTESTTSFDREGTLGIKESQQKVDDKVDIVIADSLSEKDQSSIVMIHKDENVDAELSIIAASDKRESLDVPFKPKHEDISTVSEVQHELASKIENDVENLGSLIYTKKKLYGILQSQKFEDPSTEDAFKLFLELLERASSYSLQGGLRVGDKRHHHSGTSGQKISAPPGYEGSGPPGFYRRQDSNASRSSRSDVSSSHGGGVQRGRVSSTPQISRRAMSPQPVLIPTEGRWVRPAMTKDETTKIDTVLRLVNGVLNKLTPDNFERLSMQVIQTLVEPLSVLVQAYQKLAKAVMANEEPVWNEEEDEARSLLAQVIGVFFDKAVDEPHFAPLYAGLCRMIADHPQLPEYPARKSTSDSTLAPVSMFRMALLHRCRAEYEKKIAWSSSSGGLTPLPMHTASTPTVTETETETDIVSAPPPTTETLDEAEIEFNRLKTKRRVLGNIAFIGHLYKHGLLREEIILSLVQEMLNSPSSDEDELECCIQMLTSTGSKLETSSTPRLDAFFTKLQTLTAAGAKLSNRIKFAIMDLIDLRKAVWHKELIPKAIHQQQNLKGKGPMGIVSAPALLRSAFSSLGASGRKKRNPTEVKSIATRPSSGKSPIATSITSTSSTGPSSSKQSVIQTNKNKFGLLNDIDSIGDDGRNTNDDDLGNLNDLLETSDDDDNETMDVDAGECVTKERTALVSILKSVMNEDPSRNDLVQMAQRIYVLLETEPSLSALLLAETFDASEAKQLKLCSFCQLMTIPFPNTLFEVLAETIRINFESWVEDMPLLAVNLGRLLAHLFRGGRSPSMIYTAPFDALKLSPEIEHSYTVTLVGSLLRNLETPLSLEQIGAWAEAMGVIPDDYNLFAQTHKIPRI